MKFLLILIAAIYFILPIDLIPDIFGLWGRIDDLFVILMAIFGGPFLKRLAIIYFKNFRGMQNDNSFSQQPQDNGESSKKTPWEILGVSENATKSEIKEAWRKKVNEYHPDRVSHLGEKLQKLAGEEFKQIQQAYEFLRDK